MIVRCLPMYGSWSGFAGAEFYVLSDEAEAGWGHPMAVRHCFDVDPDAAQMLARANDKDGKLLFYYTHLPANCVEVLDQNQWSKEISEGFLQEEAWQEAWKRNIESYAKAYETWKNSFENTNEDSEHKQWAKTGMERCQMGMERTWEKVRVEAIDKGPFRPNLIQHWIPGEE